MRDKSNLKLRPETSEQRQAQAKISEGDILEARSRMSTLDTPGRVMDKNKIMVTVPAGVVRAILDATSEK